MRPTVSGCIKIDNSLSTLLLSKNVLKFSKYWVYLILKFDLAYQFESKLFYMSHVM